LFVFFPQNIIGEKAIYTMLEILAPSTKCGSGKKDLWKDLLA